MTELALFPLQSVLLPGMPLGLQIFEPRYLQLLEDVESLGNRFGVVMITHGSEVGGEDQRSDIGVMAEIIEKQQVEDGRWMVRAVGTDRFRVSVPLGDNPYPRAEIELDRQLDGADLDQLMDRAHGQFDRFLALVGELGHDVRGITLADEPSLALYQMAAMVPVADFDRYQMLASDTVSNAASVFVEAAIGALEILHHRIREQ